MALCSRNRAIKYSFTTLLCWGFALNIYDKSDTRVAFYDDGEPSTYEVHKLSIYKKITSSWNAIRVHNYVM